MGLPAQPGRRGGNWCRRRGSNPRPSVYKTAALPLCYAGQASPAPPRPHPCDRTAAVRFCRPGACAGGDMVLFADGRRPVKTGARRGSACWSARGAEACHSATAETAFDIPEAGLCPGLDDVEREFHHLLAAGGHDLGGKLHDQVGRRRPCCLFAVVQGIPVGNLVRHGRGARTPGLWRARIGIRRRRVRIRIRRRPGPILIQRHPAVGIGPRARRQAPGAAFGVIGLIRVRIGRRISRGIGWRVLGECRRHCEQQCR